MSATESTFPWRTPRANAALKRAYVRIYELVDSPDECVQQFLPIILSFVRPELRETAEREFRENIQDPQFRLEVAMWAYGGTLELFESGKLD